MSPACSTAIRCCPLLHHGSSRALVTIAHCAHRCAQLRSLPRIFNIAVYNGRISQVPGALHLLQRHLSGPTLCSTGLCGALLSCAATVATLCARQEERGKTGAHSHGLAVAGPVVHACSTVWLLGALQTRIFKLDANLSHGSCTACRMQCRALRRWHSSHDRTTTCTCSATAALGQRNADAARASQIHPTRSVLAPAPSWARICGA